jgi:hypothetical protein
VRIPADEAEAGDAASVDAALRGMLANARGTTTAVLLTVLVGCGPIGDKGRGSGVLVTPDSSAPCDTTPAGCDSPPAVFPPAPSVNFMFDAARATPRPGNDAAGDAADEEPNEAAPTDTGDASALDAGSE